MIPTLLLAGSLFAASPDPHPDPAIALGLSIGLGFGAGQFYIGKPGTGTLFLVSEVALPWIGYEKSKSSSSDSQKVATACFVLFGLVKMTEIVVTPMQAHHVVYHQEVPIEGVPKSSYGPTKVGMGHRWGDSISNSPPTAVPADNATRASAAVGLIYVSLEREEDDGYADSQRKILELLDQGYSSKEIISKTIEYVKAHPDTAISDAITILSLSKGED